MSSTTINEVTRSALIKKYPFGKGLKAVAERCDVSERFMYKFRNGQILDPRSTIVERIYEDVTGKKLAA